MDPFIGQIIMFGGNFAPRGWAFCSGALLPIAQNTALFSILGTTYGGDGRTTFGLPELRGRAAIHPGNGPGLSNYRLGQRGGVENVILNANQIPQHFHTVSPPISEDGADQETPEGNVPAETAAAAYHDTATTGVSAKNFNTGNTGGSQQHTNIEPFCCVNFIIALVGTFPSRS